MSIRPGEIRMRGVTRTYRLLIERNITLKETIMRRGRVRSRDVFGLRDVDLHVEPGTALGVVGANGAGKSTLLKVLADIIPPDKGTVEVGGQVVSLLELGAGFHPDFTGRENVILNASIHGMSRHEIERRMDEIIAFSELDRFIDASVRTYSTGMYTRLGFAVATSLKADVLLLDEVLAVGDAAFQQKCISRIRDFQRRGTTIVFVSHSSVAVEAVCDRAIWLSGGRMLADGETETVLDAYARGLVSAGAAPGDSVIEDEAWHSARIRGVRLLNGLGEPSERFVSGEPFAIEVDYEVVEDVTPIVVLAIETADGVPIAGTDSRVRMEPPGIGPGERRARFSLPALPLLEGRFEISVRIESADAGIQFHRLDRCVEMTVFSQGRGFGPVALPGEWEVLVGATAALEGH